jgi:cephalosporin hydroxylase
MPSVMLKKARRVLRERGAVALLRRGREKVAQLWRFRRATKRIGRFADNRALLDFVFSDDAAFIRPGQVRAELGALVDLLTPMPPRNLLEIGTATGGTLFVWCQVAASEGRIYSIDLPGGEWGDGYPAWKIPLYKRFARPGQTVHLIRGDSHAEATLEELCRSLDGQLIDFLFIDGDHSYESAKRDFEMYSPLVRKGGLVGFHDIVNKDCPVDRLWGELKQGHQFWEFVESRDQGWAGIGVLKIPE